MGTICIAKTIKYHSKTRHKMIIWSCKIWVFKISSSTYFVYRLIVWTDLIFWTDWFFGPIFFEFGLISGLIFWTNWFSGQNFVQTINELLIFWTDWFFPKFYFYFSKFFSKISIKNCPKNQSVQKIKFVQTINRYTKSIVTWYFKHSGFWPKLDFFSWFEATSYYFTNN